MELDDDLPIDLEDQYFLPNSVVPVSVFIELVGEITNAYINWLANEIQEHRQN